MSPRVFNDTLQEMIKYGWIELMPYKEKAPFGNCEIKLLKKVRNTFKGNILVYHSIVQAVISGDINKTDYCVYLAMKRNLSRNKCITLAQLADDLHLDASNVGKYINNLVEKNCLLRKVNYCGTLRYLKYSFPCPEVVNQIKNAMSQSSVIQNENKDNCLDEEIDPALAV